MKKVVLGLFLIVAVLNTGCLGEAENQIMGTWKYYPTNPNPAVLNDVRWQFADGGNLYLSNLTTSEYDTARYEMYTVGVERIVKVSQTDIKDPIDLNGEWVIVDINFDKLVMGTRDHGGFIQRDLIH